MNQHTLPPRPVGLADSSRAAIETRDSHMPELWLTLARVVVLAVITVTVGFGVYALTLWPRFTAPCADALNSCLMTPEQVAPLSRLGVTPAGLTFAVVLLNCVVIGLINSVAGLLLWRRFNDVMALLVAMTLVLLPAFFTPMYMPLTGVWHSTAEMINRLAGLCFLLLLGLFPSGRFTPWWVVGPLLALATIGSGIGQGMPTVIVLPIALGSLLSIIGAQIYRYRFVSTPIQRRQTKWVVGGLILSVVVNQLFWQPEGWIPALQRKDSLYPLLLYPDFALIIAILGVTFGVAILRYRLYDIDVIIRRTLIYGVVTAILAAVYFGIVVSAQLVTERLTGQATQPPAVIVATTLLIAALFLPIRRRIQTVVDRAFYRRKYNAAATLKTFGASLRMKTDLDALCEQLIDVVDQTMQPEHVHLWLRDTNRPRNERDATR